MAITSITRHTTATAPVLSPPARIVVATVLRHAGETALFRRSRLVGSDVGLWHCITGYVEPGTAPVDQAEQELVEEAGYRRGAASALAVGPILGLADGTGAPWEVHTFALESTSREVTLNWEHDDVRWIDADEHHHMPCVPWLGHVLAAVA
jgi:8-oxo-dGTP diphosphatase